MTADRRVAVVARVYGRALRLLPADLVAEHGGEAMSDFARLARAADARHGWLGLVSTLSSALLDVALQAVAEHWRSIRLRALPSDGSSDDRVLRRGRVDMVKDMVVELLQAGRALMRRPVYAGIAVVTLGLGIGANIAIFTVVNAVLLRPLPYPDSDRIVQIRHHAPGLNLPELNNSPGLIQLYRRDASELAHVTATDVGEANLTGADQPARIRVVSVDDEFFEVFGTRPMMGRAFGPGDVSRDAAPVVILMHSAWQSRFGGDPAIIGRSIDLDGESTEIVGVMPAGFAYPDPETVAFVPFYLDVAGGFSSFGIRGLARLAPGADLETARSQIEAMQSRIPDEWTEIGPEFLARAGWGVSVDRLRDLSVQGIKGALWVLFGTVALVLLIAAANVANLFLVRAESRHREVAIRSALGANRGRLASIFLSESLLLGLVGGVLGVALAAIGVRLLLVAGPSALPRLHEIGIDGVALAFGGALSLLVGTLLGVLPVTGMHASSVGGLRDGGRGATASRRRHRARHMLIVGQVALALVLLAGSGLLLRSVARLSNVDTGIRSEGVLTVGVAWGSGENRTAAASFYERVLDGIAAIPGVQAVGAVNAVPFDPSGLNGGSFHIESQPRAEDEIPATALFSVVTPGWFEAVGMHAVEGRLPRREDQAGGPPVVWISERFAHDHFPAGAVGERLRFGNDTVWAEIAGVVNDVRTMGLREDIGLMAYYPVTATASTYVEVMHFAVRTTGSPAALLPAIRATVARVDPNIPLTTARTLDEVVASSMAELSFTMVLLVIAALVALLLGSVGLYGVISYVVAQRTQEMGIRIAMGARPADVRRMVVRQGMRVTLVGIAIGLLISLVATGLLSSLLFDVSARDPLTFIVVAGILTTVSLLAASIPARRAAAVDPLVAMRADWGQ